MYIVTKNIDGTYVAKLGSKTGIGLTLAEAIGKLLFESGLVSATEENKTDYKLNMFEAMLYAVGRFNGEQWHFWSPHNNSWQVSGAEGEGHAFALLRGRCLLDDPVAAQNIVDAFSTRGTWVRLCVFGFGRMQVIDHKGIG